MSLSPQSLIPPAIRLSLAIALSLLLWVPPALSQKPAAEENNPLKYDRQTEMKTKGVVEEVSLLTVGARKDFVELTVKTGEDKVHIYLCPKPFQEEMGISFGKGDEVAITGSKVKQEASEVILAREVVRGTDTLQFRDDKGNPVWDWRTGK